MKTFYIFGPPGTGKTTRLATKDIPQAIDKFGADKVMVVSFTKTAALKIANQKSRETGHAIELPPANVGTLHSICYHALKQPTIIETDKKLIRLWNEKYEQFGITGQSVSSVDETGDEYSGNNTGDKILNQVNIMRNRMIGQSRWLPRMINFYKKWCDFKTEINALDFTDLIEICLKDVPYAPVRPKVIFIDESQDITILQLALIKSWGFDCEWIVLVGDDDQCSIRGTKVLTTKGYKNIENLNPAIDRLSAYSRTDCRVYTGTHNNGGYKFKIAEHSIRDKIYEIKCDLKSTSVTSNHIWLTKWSTEAKKPNKTVIYIMEKNGYYRIGWCQLFRADGCFHVAVRTRLENATQTWILDIVDSKAKASMQESFYATTFGIPMLPFLEHSNSYLYTQDFLDTFWKKFKKDDLSKNAFSLIRHFKKDPSYPFWTKKMARTRRGGKTIMRVRTCNLFSNLMLIPSYQPNNKIKWENFSISYAWYQGKVYSLDVEKYHTYIADGLITHNCIYRFSGASPDSLLDPSTPENMKTVLQQSYRVPQVILDRATKLITKVDKREPKKYYARKQYYPDGPTIEGKIHQHNANWRHPEDLLADMKIYFEQEKTIMFLASCSFMLSPLIALLKKQGIAYHNPFRLANRAWNPISPIAKGISAKDILTNFLSTGVDEKYWNVPQFISWAQFLKVDKSGLKYKIGKAGIKALKQAVEDNQPGLHTTKNVFKQILTEDAAQQALNRNVQWLIDNLLDSRSKGMVYPYKIYLEHGLQALEDRPRNIVGTIHSAKGEDSEVVAIFPDLSWQAETEMKGSNEGRDSIYRMFYVAMTRAREELIICAPATRGGAKQEPKLFVQL